MPNLNKNILEYLFNVAIIKYVNKQNGGVYKVYTGLMLLLNFNIQLSKTKLRGLLN